MELKLVLKAPRRSQTTDKCAVKLQNLSVVKWKKYRFSCGFKVQLQFIKLTVITNVV